MRSGGRAVLATLVYYRVEKVETPSQPLYTFYVFPAKQHFLSGRCWARTSDLCRVKVVKRVLACPTMSENYAILQVFYETCRGGLSTVYALVPARLY